VPFLVDSGRRPDQVVKVERTFEPRVLGLSREQSEPEGRPVLTRETYAIEAPPAPPENAHWELVFDVHRTRFVRQVRVLNGPSGEAEQALAQGAIFRLDAETEHLRLTVDPDQGAGILACFAGVAGGWLPLMPDVRAAGCDLSAASFLMMPYSNRIENGSFTFGGREYQLSNGREHSIHGDVRKRPWRVVEHDAQGVHCTFASADHEGVNWPWPFAKNSRKPIRENSPAGR